jgi:hypothetical protein
MNPKHLITDPNPVYTNTQSISVTTSVMLGRSWFHPNPFQFITHRLSYHLVRYNLRYCRLHKTRRAHEKTWIYERGMFTATRDTTARQCSCRLSLGVLWTASMPQQSKCSRTCLDHKVTTSSLCAVCQGFAWRMHTFEGINSYSCLWRFMLWPSGTDRHRTVWYKYFVRSCCIQFHGRTWSLYIPTRLHGVVTQKT